MIAHKRNLPGTYCPHVPNRVKSKLRLINDSHATPKYSNLDLTTLQSSSTTSRMAMLFGSNIPVGDALRAPGRARDVDADRATAVPSTRILDGRNPHAGIPVQMDAAQPACVLLCDWNLGPRSFICSIP